MRRVFLVALRATTLKTAELCVLILLSAVNSFAINSGDHVYVKTEVGTWMPATYVGTRADCFTAEQGPKGEIVKLEAPSEQIEGKIEQGAEIFRHLPGRKTDIKIKMNIRDVGLRCHEVDKLGGSWIGRAYAKENEVIPASAFKESIGRTTELSNGALVYSQDPVTPETWSLYRVVSKQQQCLETDSERVLGRRDFEGGYLSSVPNTAVKNPKAGQTVFLRPSFKPDVWVKVKIKIKKRTKDTLTLLLPYVEGDGFFEEKVKVSDLRAVPPILTEAQFNNLKQGETVLQYDDPQACDYVGYIPRKILRANVDCYEIQNAKYGDGAETLLALPTRLIEEGALRYLAVVRDRDGSSTH
ncbi:MAG: hypothetical protein U0136_07480 [Bdellovibrionota bacterium]